mmetsp:Transcript_42799/g.126794  ORF Transcript_42799/g.126794 Transcript_42799/m.126794 type:complete len:292 (-) Transcript_42799:331-1206(-)
MHREGDARHRGQCVDDEHGPEVYGLHVRDLLDHHPDVRVADVEGRLVLRVGLHDRRRRAHEIADGPQQDEDDEGEEDRGVLELEVEHHADSRDVLVLEVGGHQRILPAVVIPCLGEVPEAQSLLEDLPSFGNCRPQHRRDDISQHREHSQEDEEVDRTPVPPVVPPALPVRAKRVASLALGAAPLAAAALLARGDLAELAAHGLRVGEVHDRVLGLAVRRGHAAHVADPADLHPDERTGTRARDLVRMLPELHPALDGAKNIILRAVLEGRSRLAFYRDDRRRRVARAEPR